MSQPPMRSEGRLLVVTKNDFRAEMDGGSLRTAAVVRSLERRGFAVDFVAVKPFATSLVVAPTRLSVTTILRMLRTICSCFAPLSFSALKWLSPRALLALASVGSDDGPPIAAYIFEHSQLAAYRHLADGPVVMNMHNVESVLLENYAASATGTPRRSLAAFEARQMKRIESRFMSQFDLLTVVSGHDLRELQVLPADNSKHRAAVAIASNGVSDDCFEFQGQRDRSVVFVAHLGWRPNIDAALWLTREVWPHVRRLAPELELHLVGRSPAMVVQQLATSDVRVFADVPSTVEYVGTAMVATAPLLAAGGTRLKILEALAVGTPVVATSLGALGLEGLAGPSLAIEDTAEAFAHRIVEASRSAPPVQQTRALVEEYRWDRALTPMVDGISALIGAGTAK